MLNVKSMWGRFDIADQRRLAIRAGVLKEGEPLPDYDPSTIQKIMENQPSPKSGPEVVTK
jgi:hypothetical protein